ncbi:GDSL esterase/lipase EXL3 [Ananas comosus]|uniref:GDSL esterase/lipase EXL3 n=1 Tax=Ananas comosus TaxID=4615 RepID=A0A199UKH8_ANACO|nr:GDSL esterase/lipase EXL3 [Ananas comosus]
MELWNQSLMTRGCMRLDCVGSVSLRLDTPSGGERIAPHPTTVHVRLSHLEAPASYLPSMDSIYSGGLILKWLNHPAAKSSHKHHDNGSSPGRREKMGECCKRILLSASFGHREYIVLFLVMFQLVRVLGGYTLKNQTKIPAVFAFGDSIIDPEHQPTGRFSNGKIPTDLLVSGLGIKELLPPYLWVHLSPEDLLTGVSFASGACGYDPLTSVLVNVISMTEQLQLFGEYKERLKAIAGEERARYIVSESVYLQLRQMGAKKIGFVGLPPIGCLPSQRTLGGGILRECEPRRNEAAQLFNARIQNAISELRNEESFRGAIVVYMGIYDILIDIIQRPYAYGFEEVARGCCGTGEIEVTLLCNSITAPTCPDDTKFVFWDSYHPTEKAYKIIADDMFRKYNQLLS